MLHAIYSTYFVWHDDVSLKYDKLRMIHEIKRCYFCEEKEIHSTILYEIKNDR